MEFVFPMNMKSLPDIKAASDPVFGVPHLHTSVDKEYPKITFNNKKSPFSEEDFKEALDEAEAHFKRIWEDMIIDAVSGCNRDPNVIEVTDYKVYNSEGGLEHESGRNLKAIKD